MFEIASYLPKLEKLASSLTGMGQSTSPPGTRAKHRAKKPAKKIVLVKKPAYEQMPPSMMMPSYRQPGMVYVPATWVKKNPHRTSRRRNSEDISAKHTMASLAKRRLSLGTDQNILVQQKAPKNKGLVKRKVYAKSDRHKKDENLSLGAKKAAVVLERKRLEFLQYLQEVQEEISALGFAENLVKPKTKSKKRDVIQTPKPKLKKRPSVKKDDAPPATRGKTPKTPHKRRISKVEYSKNNVKPVQSKVIDSKHSLTSMLSQESSSSTQIRMMDDAFNSNHRNYKASMNESKQTKINLGGPPLSELPGFFQWSPIPTSRSHNSTIRIA